VSSHDIERRPRYQAPASLQRRLMHAGPWVWHCRRCDGWWPYRGLLPHEACAQAQVLVVRKRADDDLL
jgi:hypothetical protein